VAQVTVEAKYIADTAQYVQALRKAADATNSLADTIPGAGSRSDKLANQTRAAGRAAEEGAKGFTVLKNAVGTAIGFATVNVVQKFAGSIKNFARASFDAAARAEELDIAMRAIGESTGQGYDAIKAASQAIRDNGIELGASQQIAIEFAQNQLDMASASKVARVAQDLAVIAGANSTATTQMLTNAIITGNSMLLKSAGISRYASEGYADMAKQLGKSKLALTAQERQQAVVNLILEEGAKVTGTYEASMNSAGKVLRSFKRIINDIQVEVGRILLDAFGPLIKATYDLISAFSKTLREGGSLSDTVKDLNTKFAGLVTPLVEAVKGFTEMVKSGEALERVGNIASSMMPILSTFFDLVRMGASVFGGLFASAAKALASILESVAPLIERIARFIESLPGPVKAAAGALLIMNIALKKTTISLATMNAGVIKFGKTTVAQMRLASASVLSFRTAALMSFHAIKAGFRSLMASIGPVGWTIIALGAAFEIFSGQSADAEAKTAELRDTLDSTTRAMTDLTEATLNKQLTDMLSAEDIAVLAKYGITMDEMAAALREGGDAVDAVGQKFNNAINPIDRYWNAVGDKAVLLTAERNYGGVAKIMDEVRLDAERLAADTVRNNEEVQLSNRLMAEEMNGAYRNISAAQIIAAEIAKASAGKFITQAERHKTAMTALELATTAAVDAMKTAFEGLDATLNRFVSADKVRDSLLAMRKQLGKNKAGIDEFDGAARKNRDTVVDYVQNLQTMAKSFDDPRDQLKMLERGLKEVEKELVGQGKKPEKSKLYRDLKASVDAAKTEVDNMADAATNAETAGIDVTEALVKGIVETVEKNKGALDAAGAASGEAVIDSLYDAMGVKSPSTKAIYAAEMMVLGLVTGLERGTGRAVNAMRGMMRGTIDAGQDEAGIHSESDATYFMGKMFAEGASSGITKNSKKAEGAARFSAKKIMEAFGESLNFSQGMRGGASFMDQASAFFGSLPSMPSPLEEMFGKKGAEAFLKKHENDLVSMQRVFMDMDRLSLVVRSAGDSLREIHGEMTGVQGLYEGKPIQAPSELIKALGSEGNLSSAISMMSSMSEQIDNAYAALLETVNKGQRKAVRAQRKATSGYLKAMTAEVAGLMIRRDEIVRELSAIEKTYGENVSRINEHYNNLDKAASKYSDSLQEKWSKAIPPLEDALRRANEAFEKENQVLQRLISERDSYLQSIRTGFRGFVNALSFDSGAKQIVRETQQLANGITVTFEREITVGGGADGIRKAFEDRLRAVQEFSQNIRSLMARGLDPTLIQEFVSAGVSSAGQAVAALAGAGESDIAAINAAQAGLASEIAEFSQYASAQWFDAGIAQQEAIVAPLRASAAAAQAALTLAQETRDRELEAARDHADMLRDLREKALSDEYNAYVVQRDKLQVEADAIDVSLNAAAEKIRSYFADLLNPEDGLPVLMKRAGIAAMRGLLKGLNSLSGEVMDRARAIATSIRREIESALRISSPSRVMENIGAQIAQGLIDGMESSERAVASAAGSLANQVVLPMQTPNFSGISAAPYSATPSMTGGGGGSAVTNISISVNAGMGADGEQVGEQIVSALRKYQRRNGALPLTVAS
jgi:hypothetical protein